MSSVINLVKTNNGYSLVDGNSLVNKSFTKASKERTLSTHKKLVQNFTIYPYISNKEHTHKYIVVPARAQWFSLSSVHEIQKKALPEWFKQKKPLFGTKQQKFQKNEQFYKKYRNHIIQLAKQSYLTSFKARSGLAGDACAIIRIHEFLQKWGLINYVYPKGCSQPNHKINMSLRKDCFDRDKALITKSYNKDDLELLKKVSKQMRPHCHFCEGICGIVWYEYNQKVVLKNFEGKKITPAGQSMQYCLRLCASCFCEGNIPIVLNMSNFKRVSIIDAEEYRDKKKSQGNKIIDLLEKNKLNFKKTAQQLKTTQESIYHSILHIPTKKIEKLKTVELETDTEPDNEEEVNTKDTNAQEQPQPYLNGFTKEEEIHVMESERKIYEEMLQYWIEKVNLKMKKLQEWDKTANWTAEQCIKLQKNTLADHIKNLLHN